MSTKPKDQTDSVAGLLFMALGGFFGWQVFAMEIGTSLRMGPGYFPMVLSGLLSILGAVILFNAFGRVDDVALGRITWRGILFILPAPIFFGLTVRGLGFVPALFITTLIAGQASMRMRPSSAGILAVVVTIISTMIFSYGLGLPFRRFGPWLPL